MIALQNSLITVGATMVISFSHDIAWKQLIDEGRVVTFRSQRRKNPNGRTWCNRGRGQTKEFDVEISEIGQAMPTDKDLEPYVDFSGFDSVNEWETAIQNLNSSTTDSGWLYEVTPTSESTSEYQASSVGNSPEQASD